MKDAKIFGLVVAGGQSQRMGGTDKAFLKLGNVTLVEACCGRLGRQVRSILVNSNAPPDAFTALGLEAHADFIPGYLGPLAGILTGLEWAKERWGDEAWVVSVAVDTPFFPEDLTARLFATAQDGKFPAAIASSGGRAHPVFGIWSVSLAEKLRHSLTVLHMRKVMAWTQSIPCGVAEWPSEPIDPFTNINTSHDLDLVKARQLP